MQQNQIEDILKEKNIKINKVLGQNFLINQKVVSRMIEAADLKKNDQVLEVGPGLGILTEEISKNDCKLIAIEKDRNLIPYLNNKFKNYKNIKIKEGNILKEKIDLQDYKIVANLPFYLTSKFLRLFLEKKNKPKMMILLMQKEVAERIVALPGEMSILSVACSLYGEAEIVEYVSSDSFYPSPAVDGTILKIRTYQKPFYKGIKDIKLFFRIVRAGFSARRKQLHNNLSAGLLISDDDARNILSQAKIDPMRRAQTLSLEEWVGVYQAVMLNINNKHC